MNATSNGIPCRELDILLIRGAPGIGKSTLGELLRTALPQGAVVDIDILRRMVNAEKFECNDNEHYENAVRASCAVVKAVIGHGCTPVVVIDVFAMQILGLFMRGIGDRAIASVTLYAEDDVLLTRMAQRPSGYINLEVARSVNRHMRETRNATDVWIDTSLLNPYGVRRKVLESTKI